MVVTWIASGVQTSVCRVLQKKLKHVRAKKCFLYQPWAKLQIGDIKTIIGNRRKDIIIDDASDSIPLLL